MTKRYMDPPQAPLPRMTREDNRRNLQAYQHNRDVYRRLMGKDAPPPYLPEPPLPPHTNDARTDAYNRELYLISCEHYRNVMGRWPGGYVPSLSL
jgi:hypothetical protein